MKFERTDTFKRDWRKLPNAEKVLFRVAVERFKPAAEAFVAQRAPWPASLRVKSVVSVSGVFEMTWSFSGPDGRATFEWIEVDGEPAIRWRRIGDHAVFKRP